MLTSLLLHDLGGSMYPDMMGLVFPGKAMVGQESCVSPDIETLSSFPGAKNWSAV